MGKAARGNIGADVRMCVMLYSSRCNAEAHEMPLLKCCWERTSLFFFSFFFIFSFRAIFRGWRQRQNHWKQHALHTTEGTLVGSAGERHNQSLLQEKKIFVISTYEKHNIETEESTPNVNNPFSPKLPNAFQRNSKVVDSYRFPVPFTHRSSTCCPFSFLLATFNRSTHRTLALFTNDSSLAVSTAQQSNTIYGVIFNKQTHARHVPAW